MRLRGSFLTGRNALVHLEFMTSFYWPAACTLFTSPKCPGVYVWMCASVDLCPLHCIFLYRRLDSNSPRWMSSVGCRRLGAIFARNTSNPCTFFFLPGSRSLKRPLTRVSSHMHLLTLTRFILLIISVGYGHYKPPLEFWSKDEFLL